MISEGPYLSFSFGPDFLSTKLTKMQKDLSILPLHSELVFAEEFLVQLLFDLCHYVLSFLKEHSAVTFQNLKVFAAES